MRGTDSDLDFAQDASISGQFAHLWELRIMSKDGAFREIANSELRRLGNKSSGWADVKVGELGFFFRLAGRKSSPERAAPSVVLDVDETGVAAKFRGPSGHGCSLLRA